MQRVKGKGEDGETTDLHHDLVVLLLRISGKGEVKKIQGGDQN